MMTDYFDPFGELRETLDRHEEAIKDFRKNGKAFSLAKRDYRIALQQKMTELRFDKSYPVTLVPDLARGDEHVAQLGYERDYLHAEFEADRSLLEYLKNKTWILQRQHEMEMKGR